LARLPSLKGATFAQGTLRWRLAKVDGQDRAVPIPVQQRETAAACPAPLRQTHAHGEVFIGAADGMGFVDQAISRRARTAGIGTAAASARTPAGSSGESRAGDFGHEVFFPSGDFRHADLSILVGVEGPEPSFRIGQEFCACEAAILVGVGYQEPLGGRIDLTG
jgi:hypothetical protein